MFSYQEEEEAQCCKAHIVLQEEQTVVKLTHFEVFRDSVARGGKEYGLNGWYE